jgi:hypothetical protein
MKRTGFVRKPGKEYSVLARTSTLKRSGPIKTRRKRPTVAEGSKLIDACRGEQCYLRVAGICCGDTATVVPCHSNQARHGKGMGLKAAHEFTVPGCWRCHSWLDQGPASRETKAAVFDAALAAWQPARAEKMGVPACN